MRFYKEFKEFEIINVKEGDNIRELIKDENYEYYVLAIDDGCIDKGELGLLEVGEIRTKDTDNIKKIIKVKKEKKEA